MSICRLQDSAVDYTVAKVGATVAPVIPLVTARTVIGCLSYKFLMSVNIVDREDNIKKTEERFSILLILSNACLGKANFLLTAVTALYHRE